MGIVFSNLNLELELETDEVFFIREVVHREMLFYRIPIFDEQEAAPVELPVPTTRKEKVHLEKI